MKVTLDDGATAKQITYPAILDDTWEDQRVIVLASSDIESVVLRSWHHNFKVGDQYGEHTEKAVMYNGVVLLEN
jgi:hypothetical protein